MTLTDGALLCVCDAEMLRRKAKVRSFPLVVDEVISLLRALPLELTFHRNVPNAKPTN